MVRTMKQHFWNRWSKEYLNQLQPLSKWKNETEQPQVGDLVLLAEDNVAPMQWPVARILELYLGNDKVARVAKIKTKNSIFMRPLNKLHPLPKESIFESKYLNEVQGAEDVKSPACEELKEMKARKMQFDSSQKESHDLSNVAHISKYGSQSVAFR